MNKLELQTTAQALVAPGKGLLAADESAGTIKKRFDSIGLDSTETTRRAYRELLFTTPDIARFISGVILYDETLRQCAQDGTPFPDLLAGRGIIPGIKVDLGAKDMAGFPDEKITEGLDGLRQRLADYRSSGARFAKWRAVLTIGRAIPTAVCIEANAHALARYAALCQEAGIVPIVEPEVLMDGNHDLARCEEVTGMTLKAVFDQLAEQRIVLSGMLLKPNMVLSGKEAGSQAGIAEVAAATRRCLHAHVPEEVAGVAFLSGGQTPELASARLNAMNALEPMSWPLTFSYSRALQEPVLQCWQGKTENAPAARRLFYHRARLNSAARSGSYVPEMENSPD